MHDYEEIANSSDKKILVALDKELEEISHEIGAARFSYEMSKHPWEREILYENLERLTARYTGASDARTIVYNAMQKKY